MFGRSKLLTNTRGASRSSRATISARVGSVAVAVSAMRGTPGNHSLSTFKPRYSARKSWPHCDTQCASSMAMIAMGHLAQQRLRFLLEQPFRGEIEQLEAAVSQVRDDVALLGAAQRRVQERRRHARFAQRAHLILHERDQRRHDDADAVAQERRYLVAQGLAAARRHQYERIVPGNGGCDDRFLLAAVLGIAEHLAQQLPGAVFGGLRSAEAVELHRAMMPQAQPRAAQRNSCATRACVSAMILLRCRAFALEEPLESPRSSLRRRRLANGGRNRQRPTRGCSAARRRRVRIQRHAAHALRGPRPAVSLGVQQQRSSARFANDARVRLAARLVAGVRRDHGLADGGQRRRLVHERHHYERARAAPGLRGLAAWRQHAARRPRLARPRQAPPRRAQPLPQYRQQFHRHRLVVERRRRPHGAGVLLAADAAVTGRCGERARQRLRARSRGARLVDQGVVLYLPDLRDGASPRSVCVRLGLRSRERATVRCRPCLGRRARLSRAESRANGTTKSRPYCNAASRAAASAASSAPTSIIAHRCCTPRSAISSTYPGRRT